MTTPAFDLFSSALSFREGGQVRVEQQMFDPERTDWQLMAFHVETDADVHADQWEIHSDADEVVACLTARMRLYFRPERTGEREEEIILRPGTAVIVPRGRWHRIELDVPGDMMAVTVARGSRLEDRAES